MRPIFGFRTWLADNGLGQYPIPRYRVRKAISRPDMGGATRAAFSLLLVLWIIFWSVVAVTIAGLFVLGIWALSTSANAADYVPGMTCEQVGDFSVTVALQKTHGESRKQQISDMRQSIPDYPGTQHALEQIILGIYGSGPLSRANPDDVGDAYRKSCEFMSH